MNNELKKLIQAQKHVDKAISIISPLKNNNPELEKLYDNLVSSYNIIQFKKLFGDKEDDR